MIAYRQNLAPILPLTRQPAPAKRRISIPETIQDPLARQILMLVHDSPQTWAMLEASAGRGTDAVRMWFYRPQFNPGFAMVQAVLAVLGWRLRLEKITNNGAQDRGL